MSFPGIIENSNSELVVSNCLFQDNIYGDDENPATYGYAIRSFGPMTLESTCFIDNVFLDHGPVLIYGAQYSATNNYVQSSQTDLTCEFLALFNSQDDQEDTLPTCEMSDADTCSFTQPPTSAPTEGILTPSPSQTSEQVETTAQAANQPTGDLKGDGKSSSAAASIRMSELFVGLMSLFGLFFSAIHM
jgi:hypothetical protein